MHNALTDVCSVRVYASRALAEPFAHGDVTRKMMECRQSCTAPQRSRGSLHAAPSRVVSLHTPAAQAPQPFGGAEEDPTRQN